MKIFICWSGDRSKIVAEALRKWLPNVFQDAEPWISEKDISKGAQWRADLHEQLEASSFGIVCVTPENLDSNWLLFEAGALSKAPLGGEASVCTFLIEISPGDVPDPLGQFQHTSTTKSDTFKLMKTINDVRGERAFAETRMHEIFETWWPKLEGALARASEFEAQDVTPFRDEREILEDVLEAVRRLERDLPKKIERAADLRYLPRKASHGLLSEGVSALYKMSENPDAPDPQGRKIGAVLREAMEGGACAMCGRLTGDLQPEIAEGSGAVTWICGDCREPPE